jgi:hypothetical protein
MMMSKKIAATITIYDNGDYRIKRNCVRQLDGKGVWNFLNDYVESVLMDMKAGI